MDKPADYEFYKDSYQQFLDGYNGFHFAHPGLNFQSQDVDPANIDFLLKKEFNYSFEHYSVLSCGEDPTDCAQVLVSNKNEWLERLKLLKLGSLKGIRKDLRQLRKFRKGRDRSLSLRPRLFIDHMKDDPLPGFIGSRNWIFSGSTVMLLEKNDICSTIVACGGRNLSCLRVLCVDEDGFLKDDHDFMLKNDEPILQICTNSSPEPIVATRQQHYINIYRVRNNSFQRVRRKSVPKDSYFTSAALRANQMALSKNSGSVAVFDIEENKLKFSFPGRKPLWKTCGLGHFWNNLHWRDDGLWVVNEKTVYQVDGCDVVNTWDLTETLDACEEATLIFDSKLQPHLPLIATTHCLFQMDLRNKKFVKKWNHMMGKPPAFGNAVKLVDGEELLLIHSSAVDDGVGIVNGTDAALLPPHLTPSVTDSFREAKLQLHCLDPDVGNRPYFSVIGCCYIPVNNGGIHEVVQNAGGDLFIRKIQENGDHSDISDLQPDDERIWETWDDYESRCTSLSITDKPMFSEVVDMTIAFNSLRLPPPEPPQWGPSKAKWKNMSKFHPDQLKFYKDLIATKILPVWGILQHCSEKEEEKEEEEETEEEENEMTSIDKVTDWLNRHNLSYSLL